MASEILYQLHDIQTRTEERSATPRANRQATNMCTEQTRVLELFETFERSTYTGSVCQILKSQSACPLISIVN
jgi:hypothetical protein